MSYQKIISKNIKALRVRSGFTQEQFAEKIGLTINGVSNIERNRYQPTAETVDRICKAFKITPQELLMTDSNSNQDIINNIVTLLNSCSSQKLKKIYEIVAILVR